MQLPRFFLLLQIISFFSTSFAAAVGDPRPLSHLHIPRTTLSQRATGLTVPVCVQADVNIPLGSLLTNFANDLEAKTDCTGLLGALLCGLTGTVGKLLNGVTNLVKTLVNPDIDLGSLCICATVDALTPASFLKVTTEIEAGNSGLLGQVGKLVGNLLGFLQPVLLGIVENKVSQDAIDGVAPLCDYPANAIPSSDGATCGSACNFTCAAGFVKCSGQCLSGSVCPSGTTQQRRSLKRRSQFACSRGQTACPVSHFLTRDASSRVAGGGFECIDTAANLESCGGCVNPFRGEAAGQDCTSLPDVDSVSCEQGECVVQSCALGFVVAKDGSACEIDRRLVNSRFGVQARRQAK